MRIRKMRRRVLAALLCIALCLTLMPSVSFAGEESSNELLYGITAEAETTINSVAELTDETVLNKISTDAKLFNYGAKMGPTYDIEETGVLVSPFTLEVDPSNGTVAFTMDEPDFNTAFNQIASQLGIKPAYMIAVQDAGHPDAPVLFYPTNLENGVISTSFPVSVDKVNCALCYALPDLLVLNVDSNSVEGTPDQVFENTAGSKVSLEWKTNLKFNPDFGVTITTPLHGSVVVKAPAGQTLDVDSVKVDTEFFKVTGKSIQSDDSVLVTLEETEAFSALSYSEKEEKIESDIVVSCDAILSADVFESEQDILTPYAQFSIWSEDYGPIAGGEVMGITAVSDFTNTATMRSAVTITPADLTIYEGGNGGYDAIYDGENSDTPVSSDSLPHPLFKITAPKGSGIDPANLTFTVGDKSWTVVPDGENTGLYHFSEREGQDKVRVQYTNNATGEVVTSDEFDPNAEGIKDTFNTYTIDLYAGENDLSEVRAGVADSGTAYPISVNSGTLTVRAVEAADPTSDVVVGADGADLIPTEEQVPAANEAVALVPAGTTYTLNGLEGVTLPEVGENGSKPSLLFDDIIASDGVDRIGPLEDATDTALGGAAGDNVTRTYQTKYLDLVDANNGNAWIKASDNVTIYWGYPEGTNLKTEFKIVHFKDLHRDNSNGNTTGFNPDDINADNVEVFSSDATDEALKLETTDHGIKFEVTPGNFSPYVLVWDVDNTPDPGPGTDPDPDTPVGPVHPVDPTPELERGDHYAYIVGYEDDTIRPQNNITRAEVATIFFRLLTDESREAYFTTDCDFTDVNGSAWYANTVATLSNAGILAGYPDGSFRPNDPITRAEFAAIATRFDDLAAADSTFTDIDGHWAEDAINAAYGAGWVGGYPDGTFRPNNNITRAEVMSLVNRVLDREVDEDGMLDDMLTWIDNEPGTWYYEAVQEATNSHDYERKDADSVETWTQINEPIDWDAVEEELVNSH